MEEREKKKSVCEKEREREREEGALSSTPVGREERGISRLQHFCVFFFFVPALFVTSFPCHLILLVVEMISAITAKPIISSCISFCR